MSQSLQILAPAGNTDMLKAAVYSGADCVYLGVKGFNARRMADNFENDALHEAVQFCHARNCKVHAAVNTVALPMRQDGLEEAICQVRDAGCDAIIVQDLAALKLAKRIAPNLPIHASTQMGVHSLAGVQKLADWGFSCAILARELKEEEIAEIAAKSPIDLEVFIHGALCVSMSGQCYASAFLGGRSANKGACAGPCRLPFCMEDEMHAQKDTYRLSLKDFSVIDALPRLEKMGVAAAKIEGRLRGPEYCAVAVDSAKKALNGEEYDKKLLQEVFSRSGLTGGWFSGKQGIEMFGVRTEEDTKATKKAWPKAKELYRREKARVAVDMKLFLCKEGARLLVSDDVCTVEERMEQPLDTAKDASVKSLQQALAKTGGTPFYLKSESQVETQGFFLASSLASAMRRNALEKLLKIRENRKSKTSQIPEDNISEIKKPRNVVNKWKKEASVAKTEKSRPMFIARFEDIKQMSDKVAMDCDVIILPISMADEVPQDLRKKTYLWLPRALFGQKENTVRDLVEKTAKAGFAGFEVNSIAHIELCKKYNVIYGPFMNVTNDTAAEFLASSEDSIITLSMELSSAQMKDVARNVGEVATAAVAYGHMPLMMTRACPLGTGTSCKKCSKKGVLVDRKGARFSVRCDKSVRQIYNPHVLWLAEYMVTWPCDAAIFYFTDEDANEVKTVIQRYKTGQKATKEFTRGLFLKGIQD